MSSELSFTEHRIPRHPGTVYARDYPGSGPAFVLMHGFPDNLHIWDDLIPYLVSAGRRLVTFDFLGFGASDKGMDVAYSFQQQLGDLEAVVEGLGLGKIVPVAHDSSGPAAINYALAHPDGIDSLIMLNSAYAEESAVLWPEMVTLFATAGLHALAMAIAQSPEQFGWLLAWQRQKFREALSEAHKPRFDEFMGPLISDNFVKQPSSGPAFVQMAGQFHGELARNSGRLDQVAALDMPAKVIWGTDDPYLATPMGKARAALFRHGTFHPVPAGHWLQSDEPALVAKEMLS